MSQHEEIYGRDPTSERLTLALCELGKVVGWSLVAVFAYFTLGDLVTSVRDWWHGADFRGGNLAVGFGMLIGYMLANVCTAVISTTEERRKERHEANWKRWDENRRIQVIEDRRQARIDFADDRARRRGEGDPNWVETRIPEELWEGCEVRTTRLHDWGVLLDLEFDYDKEKWVKFGEATAD